MGIFNITTNNTLYQSAINTPVYSDLNIKGDSYTLDGIEYEFPDLNIPEAVFVSAPRKKNLVITSVNSEDGDIVEYLGSSNRIIEVEIRLTGQNLNFPQNTFSNLMLMLNSNQVLTIRSWYLNGIGVYNAIVTEDEPLQKKGELNNPEIHFKLMAIKPLILMGNTGAFSGGGNESNINTSNIG